MIHVIDTHALVWYLEGGQRLGDEALKNLDDPSARIVIPAIVLAEAKYLAARKRTRISFEEILSVIRVEERMTIYPVNTEVISLMDPGLEMHDALICATALVYRDALGQDVRVITRDEAIARAGIVETIW